MGSIAAMWNSHSGLGAAECGGARLDLHKAYR